MQITLNEEEIKDAIVAYVRQQIAITDTQRIEVDLKAGRGDNGYSATLDIRPAQAPSTAGTKSTKVVTTTRNTSPDIAPEAEPAQPTSKFRGLKPVSAATVASSKEAPEQTRDEESSDDVVDADATETAESAESHEGTKEEDVAGVPEEGGADPAPAPEEEPEPAPAVIKPTRSIFNVAR